jgi:phosphotransferase system enzyme I (PtsI)
MLYKGLGVSPGIAIGKAFTIRSLSLEILDERPSDPEEELQRFMKAISSSVEELRRMREKAGREMGREAAAIFEAHIEMIEDPIFLERVKDRIRNGGVSATYAVANVVNELIDRLSNAKEGHFRERISDLMDVGGRILRHLGRPSKQIPSSIPNESIVVAYDLAPSITMHLPRDKVVGIATDVGSQTSHTVILAKALEIPAVVGLERITQVVKDGDTLILDGSDGTVIVNPDEELIRKYRSRYLSFLTWKKMLEGIRDLPAETIDGHRVILSANIEMEQEMESLSRYGAHGIGLYRTEYLFIDRASLPSEEEQFEVYKRVAEMASPYPVTIRTVDIGGDKFVSYLDLPEELNPFMGLRGIRLCLQRCDIFDTQIRAILKASAFGKIRIMFPMISDVKELRDAKRRIGFIMEDLSRKGIPFDDRLKIGAMIEVPSAALTARILAKEADFLSIGTNDLIQYCLAVDRVNERVSYLYDPFHPSVLLLIRETVEAARTAGIPVSVCGEMAGDPFSAALLVGLGVDELSMSTSSIPAIKEMIRSTSYEELREMARKALSMESGEEIRELIAERISGKFICQIPED